MSNMSSIFPVAVPQHFTGNGFDPRIDYFQILPSKNIKKNSHRKKWWRYALFFFKWNKRKPLNESPKYSNFHHRNVVLSGSISGPVYITESRNGSNTPRRKTRRPFSGSLAGSLIPSKKGDLEIPYVNLKEFNLDRQQTTSATPIYLVT
ncbi:PREDICTED: uncharacterized protein LOC109217930 [Nicotiana attenuata]|uniref:Uncharacterized protein n=1 Tax=Nicotiana attenuata TaxID=49451 RepID=A0A1J6KK72_NICAT|nr:PREDICTED: uncharacterized protein LOC109217930 [Nicotiana attenuata]OIT22183.1 hypothetical protein A4A49_33398 [Nicotiana attenuata]